MKKNKIIIFLILIILLAVILFVPASPLHQFLPTQTINNEVEEVNLGNICTASGGTWLGDYKECEGAGDMLSEEKCTELGGKYFECESPCRHNPQTEMCIKLCMKVCKF